MAALVVGTAAVAPFFFSRREKVPGTDQVLRLIDTHDLWMHLFIMEEFDKVLGSGVIYPRWIPDINQGYGLLNMIYYPPGVFYLSSLFHTIIKDWHYVVFAISALALAGSGLTLYFLARAFYSRTASAIAGLFYMLIPFHMLDLYYRGALPQFVGYVFVPLIFYFVYRLGRESRPRYYAGLGLTFGLYLLTHLPVSLMLTYAIAFLAVVWSIRERDLRIGIRIAVGLSLGLMLGAIYWLPAAVETKYAFEYASEWYPYHNYKSYITLLAVEEGGAYWTFWKLLNHVFVAHAVAVIAPITILSILPKRPAEDFGLAKLPDGDSKPLSAYWAPTRMWVVMGAVTLFMCTSLSIYLSKLIPKIDVAVPAWRWLVIASVFTSLLVAASIDRLRKSSGLSPQMLWGCRFLLGAAIVFNLWITINGTMLGALENSTYHPKAETTYGVIEPNWTPKGSTLPQDLPDTPNVVMEPEGGVIQVTKWDPQKRVVSVKLDQPARMRLKTYNFRGWTAYIDGNKVPMLSDSDGIQVIDVPAGIHTIEADFLNSPPRTLGTVAFSIGLLAIAGLALVEPLRRRKLRGEEPASGPAFVDNPGVEEAGAETEPHDAGSGTATRAKLRLPVGNAKILAGGVILIIALASAVLIARRPASQNQPAGSTSPSRDGAARSSIAVGSDARLHIDGREFVMVAVDERALNELIQSMASKDESKTAALTQSGKSFMVADNTKVRIIQSASGMAKVRISEGEDIMKEGWVPDRWLR